MNPREGLLAGQRLIAECGIDLASAKLAYKSMHPRIDQVIEDPTVLDALPSGSVILAGGQAWQSIRRAGPLWLLAGGSSDRSSLYVLRVFGSATVLHTPTETGDGQ